MRTLLVLVAALLSLGAYFTEHEPPPDDAEQPICRSATCKRHAPFRGQRAEGEAWPIPPRGGAGDYHYDCDTPKGRAADPSWQGSRRPASGENPVIRAGRPE